MKFATAALTLALVGTAHAACTEDDSKAMTDCTTKLKLPTNLTDTTAFCKYYKDSVACYPTCICGEDSIKAAWDALEKGYKDMKCEGTIKCGAGSVMAPGLALASVAIVVAKLLD